MHPLEGACSAQRTPSAASPAPQPHAPRSDGWWRRHSHSLTHVAEGLSHDGRAVVLLYGGRDDGGQMLADVQSIAVEALLPPAHT